MSEVRSFRRRARLAFAALAVAALILPPVPAGAGASSARAAGYDDALTRLATSAVEDAAAPAASRAASVEVVAGGLHQPRGLDFGPDGSLYIAEVGDGGDECVDIPGSEGGGESCFGLTGGITRVRDGAQERIVDGLPSRAGPDGFAATGVHDVAARFRRHQDAVIGLGGNLSNRNAIVRAAGPAYRRLGQAVWAGPGGGIRGLADPVVWEHRNDPSAGQPGGAFEDTNDSNPTSILAERGRRVVVDAGGNTLLALPRRTGGRIKLMALFPDRFVDAPPFLGLPPGTQIPMQAVPTAVAKGPDGAYYVGELTGFPFPEGGARVWRVVEGQEPEVFAEGFTHIIDLTFDADGHLYVLQLTDRSLLELFGGEGPPPTGSLRRVPAGGSSQELVAGDLMLPGGVDAGPDGALYVTTNTILPGGAGQVVRIEP